MKARSTLGIPSGTIIEIQIRIMPGNRIRFIPIKFPEDHTGLHGDTRIEAECGVQVWYSWGLVGIAVPCCRPEGLLVPFTCSRGPVSAATGVGALPSREMALFTTATWVAGKKSKWQSQGSVGVGEG